MRGPGLSWSVQWGRVTKSNSKHRRVSVTRSCNGGGTLRERRNRVPAGGPPRERAFERPQSRPRVGLLDGTVPRGSVWYRAAEGMGNGGREADHRGLCVVDCLGCHWREMLEKGGSVCGLRPVIEMWARGIKSSVMAIRPILHVHRSGCRDVGSGLR
ncbi:hypothetical protein C8Q74DRAFT_616888 [Fomes fomentarius]|nr:hypothetical protein C8Q74DRAFT_616888 [Fomes fomentarius]